MADAPTAYLFILRTRMQLNHQAVDISWDYVYVDKPVATVFRWSKFVCLTRITFNRRFLPFLIGGERHC